MLPKKIRASSTLIDAVFKKGQRVSSPAFDLIYTKTETLYSLFAVSVSKKAARTSVERHKLRRTCYNTMGSITLNGPYICVLVVKKSQTDTPTQEIRKEIVNLFIMAKIISLS